MSEIRELQNLIGGWADEVFPDRTMQSAALKLYEEIGEMLRNPSSEDEHADIYIMMFDLSRMYGIDVAAAVRRKMARNRMRSWRKTETGTLQHTGESEDEWSMYECGRRDAKEGRFPFFADEMYMKGYHDAGAENEGSDLD